MGISFWALLCSNGPEHGCTRGKLFGTGSRAHTAWGQVPSPFDGRPGGEGRSEIICHCEEHAGNVFGIHGLVLLSGLLRAIHAWQDKLVPGSSVRLWLRHEFHGLALSSSPSLERWQVRRNKKSETVWSRSLREQSYRVYS